MIPVPSMARFGRVNTIVPRKLFGMLVRWLQRPRELPALSVYHITMLPRAVHPPAYHAERDELLLVLGGSGRLRVGSRSRRLKEGEIVFIPAKQVHEVRSGSRGLRVLSIFAPAMEPKKPDIVLLEGPRARS